MIQMEIYISEDEERSRVLTERETEYIVWGRGTGDSGIAHLQGYLSLKTKKRFQQVKNLIGFNAHVEN